MGNLIVRCFAEVKKLFTAVPNKSSPDRTVATNTDREIRLQTIRAKIESLKEEDLKQKHILEYLNSNSFKENISKKILSVTLGNLDNNQDEDQENRIKILREQQEVLKKEDKRLQVELERVEAESNRLKNVLQQKQLDVQALRERVRQRQENKAQLKV